MSNIMNQPIDPNWKCEICGTKHSENLNLEWTVVFGKCSCNVCGAWYAVRKERPTILFMKAEYIEPAKKIWNEKHLHLDKVTDVMWKEYGVK